MTATEIKIGNTAPYSGPASSYGVLGKLESAFFDMVNEQGGVGGRKIIFISLENYSPPRTQWTKSPAWSRRTRSPSLSVLWHAHQQRDRALHEPEEGAAFFVSTGAKSGATTRIPHGPSGGSPAIASRRRSTRSTSYRTSPMPRSVFCIRTMISVRTTRTA